MTYVKEIEDRRSGETYLGEISTTQYLFLIPMYSRQEASQLRQEFWTAFGQYMQPILSAEGEKLNWINYKTGEKHIYFKMQADNKKSVIGIEISHPDPGVQQLYFDQFQELKKFLIAETEEEWDWLLHTYDETGRQVSRIGTTLAPVSIFKRDEWPALISFFKPRIMALDAFWSNVKYSFEELR